MPIANLEAAHRAGKLVRNAALEEAARIAETTHDANAGDLLTDVRVGQRIATAIRVLIS
jgi:hypothetical protein